MLQLLSPAGLWALAALGLPLAIHLWRPPPRTVRLGSLRFLDNLPHRRLRNPRWRERTLLAVRLMLLTALALLLARPHWRQKPPSGPQHWVLLDPAAALSGEAAARLHQLRGGGYSVHRLAAGFPVADSTPSPAPPADLWSLLREADATLPAGSTLAVFTPGRLAALHGTRPALRHCRIDWITTPDVAASGAQSWIESLRAAASADNARTARALVGTSDTASTRFADIRLPPGQDAPANPAVELSPDNSRARLSSLTTPGPWVRVDPVPPALRVVILHDPDRSADARNVEAAARAVAAVTGQLLAVTAHPIDDRPDPGQPPAADWVFWLSARPVPAAVADSVANLVSDAESGARDVPASEEGWIVAPPGTPSAASVHLWRRVPAALSPADEVETLWTDSHGEPLLTLERGTHSRRWRFYSRFHADWTDLPRTAALPALVEGMLFPAAAAPADPARDRRIADPAQYSLALTPASASVPVPAPPARPDGIDLHWPLWLFAAGLFAAERLLSRRSTRRPAAASPPAALAR